MTSEQDEQREAAERQLQKDRDQQGRDGIGFIGTDAELGASATAQTQIGAVLSPQQIQDLLTTIAHHRSVPAASSRHDGEQVIMRDVSNMVRPLKADANYETRMRWIEDVETSFQTNGSGIRWRCDGERLDSVSEGNAWIPENIRQRKFHINTVVPFNVIFSTTRDTCFLLEEASDEAPGSRYTVRVPRRIMDAIAAYVYGVLKVKIPDEQRTLLTSVNKRDGFALIQSVRNTHDGVTESTITLLDKRRDDLRLQSLDHWPTYKSDLLKLIADWDMHVKHGNVPETEAFTLYRQKELIRRTAWRVRNLDTWMDDNPDCRILSILKRGDSLVRSQKSNIERMKETKEVHAHVANSYANDSGEEYDECSNYYSRGKGGYKRQRTGYYGKGKGKGKGYKGKGKGRKGKGKGKGKGRKGKGKGKGKGDSYSPRGKSSHGSWQWTWTWDDEADDSWWWNSHNWYSESEGAGASAERKQETAARVHSPVPPAPQSHAGTAAADSAASYYSSRDEHPAEDADIGAWASDPDEWDWQDY